MRAKTIAFTCRAGSKATESSAKTAMLAAHGNDQSNSPPRCRDVTIAIAESAESATPGRSAGPSSRPIRTTCAEFDVLRVEAC